MKFRILLAAAIGSLLLGPWLPADEKGTAHPHRTGAMDKSRGMHHEMGVIHVMNPWVRAVPPGAPSSAAYLVLRNTGAKADALLAVKTPLAKHAELHTMVKSGAMMEMRPVESVPLPPGQYVKLEPGGYHVMLIELAHPPKVGEKVALLLRFRHAGEVRVEAVVTEGAPMGGMKH